MNKLIKVYDNVFDLQMLNYLDNYIQELPYYPHSSSTPDKNNFFAMSNIGEKNWLEIIKPKYIFLGISLNSFTIVYTGIFLNCSLFLVLCIFP